MADNVDAGFFVVVVVFAVAAIATNRTSRMDFSRAIRGSKILQPILSQMLVTDHLNLPLPT